MKSKGLTAISLFSGCGGSDIGLHDAGVEVVWANEKNESACEFYRAVTGSDVIHQADVREVDTFPKADLLVGCYPCQGYSQGGVRDPNSETNYLYREFDRALRQIRPKAFIVENVNGMRFQNNAPLLQNQLVRFRSAGYLVNWKVLNAHDYGVAQSRKRLIIVGIQSKSKKRFEFPDPTHGAGCKNPHLTQKNAIWSLRKKADGNYCDQPFHWYYLSRDRRKSWSEPSATIVANERHVALHPDSPKLVKVGPDKWVFDGDESTARRLSYLECAALQGFREPIRFNQQSLSLRYRAIGNAVPPPLFKAVTDSLLNQL